MSRATAELTFLQLVNGPRLAAAPPIGQKGGSCSGCCRTNEGLAISSAQRPEVVSLLGRLGDLDYGAYAKGYRIRSISVNEVELVPASGGRR